MVGGGIKWYPRVWNCTKLRVLLITTSPLTSGPEPYRTKVKQGITANTTDSTGWSSATWRRAEPLRGFPPGPTRTKPSRSRQQKIGTARVPAPNCLPACSRLCHACTPTQPEEDTGLAGSGASGRDYWVTSRKVGGAVRSVK